MKLRDLIEGVKEERLSREKLEQYYAELTSLYASFCLALAELEKDEATFLDKELLINNEPMSEAMRKRKWRATVKGQELIQTKQEVRIVEKLLQSVKHRIFNVL